MAVERWLPGKLGTGTVVAVVAVGFGDPVSVPALALLLGLVDELFSGVGVDSFGGGVRGWPEAVTVIIPGPGLVKGFDTGADSEANDFGVGVPLLTEPVTVMLPANVDDSDFDVVVEVDRLGERLSGSPDAVTVTSPRLVDDLDTDRGIDADGLGG